MFDAASSAGPIVLGATPSYDVGVPSMLMILGRMWRLCGQTRMLSVKAALISEADLNTS